MSEAVRSMFGQIAGRYDLANTVVSLGLHKRWRRRLVDVGAGWRGRAGPVRPGARVLDCATGTGDVAFELLRRVTPGGAVVGVDFAPEMLELARAKIGRLQSNWLQVPGELEAAAGQLQFEQGDVQSLRFADGAFDAATIAFGVRNLDDPRAGLAEMARVVRPGGSVLVLETGLPVNPILRWLYRYYCHYALYLVGRLISGKLEAYRYLERTIWSFPYGEEFLELMRSTGAFREVQGLPLFGGTAWIYRGVVAELAAQPVSG